MQGLWSVKQILTALGAGDRIKPLSKTTNPYYKDETLPICQLKLKQLL
jgi:hypothetical protein